MESVYIFVNIIADSWDKNDSLALILKNTSTYLKSLPTKDHGKALELIFNNEKGIFCLIDRILRLQKKEMEYFNAVLKESFIALQFIMEFFQRDFEPYVTTTAEKCFCCIKAICSFYARKAAGETYKKSIELFSNLNLKLEEFITHFNTSFTRLYTKKDGSVLFIIIGAACRYLPKLEILINSIDSIFSVLLFNLKSQYKPNYENQPVEINIYLECILDMLENFVPYEENDNQKIKYFQTLYDSISKIFWPVPAKKSVKTKAIYMLSTHIDYFIPFMFKNYQKWHELINKNLEESTIYTYLNAQRAFYKMMAKELSKINDQNIFNYFKNYFAANLKSKDLPTYKLHLTIYGLGEFSLLYRKFESSEINELFRVIALKAIHFHEKDSVDNLDVDCLNALSQILCQMTSVSTYHLNILSDLTVSFIKRFPELDNFNYELKVLKNTFINISQLEQKFQEDYFNLFFTKGILWSCSHTLLIDIELQQELENLSKRPICFQNYVPLWYSLFKIENDAKFPITLVERIFEKFSLVLISFIEKLNLNVKAEEETFFITSFSLKAENDSDFRFFINLVDLYTEVFEKVENTMFQNLAEKLLQYFIKCSYKYPMISGFYKLIEVILKKADIFFDDENSFTESTKELILQYLLDIKYQISEFFGELQLTCIYLILSTPTQLLENLNNEMISVFKIAFSMGLSNLPLAFDALDIIEKIVRHPNIKCTDEFLINIISFLNPYLSSEESIANLDQSSETKRIGNTFRDRTNTLEEKSLKNFQTKVLIFYGSLNSNVLLDFIHEKSIDTNASWNKKNLLQSELLFPDIRLEINIDKFIPRIIELTTSGDSKIKISACELLHTIISIILGKKLMDQCFDKSICKSILRLGCNVDDSIRLLFHPLVLQLSHYLSSKFMKDSRVPQDFIDALFDGLTEEFNPSLRDCCGFYLKEFFEWSIKQTDPNNLSKHVYIKSIIRRIKGFALHPSYKKRVAAAIAFNHLHKIFEKNSFIFNVYWLEFFYVFIKSMEESDNIQIHNAINYVENAIKKRASTFNLNDAFRRKPSDFPNVTLNGLLMWLFKYCGSADTKCRWKCMKIFDNLLPLASDSESIKNFLISCTEDISKDFNDNLNDLTIDKLKIFLRCLEFYTWVIEKNLIPCETLVKKPFFTLQKYVFIKYFGTFVFLTGGTLIDVNAFENDKKREEFYSLKNNINLKIIEYVSTTLNNNINPDDVITWDLYFNELITQCTLCPWKLGFNNKQLLATEKLSFQIEILLTRISNQNLSEKSLQQLKNEYIREIKKNFLPTLELIVEDIVRNSRDTKIYQCLNGIFLLNQCNFFDVKLELNMTKDQVKKKLEDVFKILKTEYIGDESCRILNNQVKDNLNQFLKFILLNYEPEVLDILINLIVNDHPLITSSGSRISHGEYFLQIFEEPISKSMLENPTQLMNLLEKYLADFTDRALLLIEKLLIFCHENKVPNSEIFAGLIISRFKKIFRLINNFENREIKFFNINRLAVSIQNKPFKTTDNESSSDGLYSWVLGQLMKAPDLEKKTVILQAFLTFMVDENSNENNLGLFIALRELKDQNLKNLASSESLRFQAAACLQLFLKTLTMKKCEIMYQIVIEYFAGISQYLVKNNIKENLNLYFTGITDALALASLKLAYKFFMDYNTFDEKLDVLRYILLPSIELSKASVVQEFCDENYGEMISFLRKKIDNIKSSSTDRKKLIITKLAFYNLFEILFANFDLNFNDVENTAPKTGKQSFKKILLEEILELRFNYFSENEEEKEIVRLLQCAAFNCCIALISLKEEEKFYKWIFYEKRSQGQCIWEKIVDCKKKYDIRETSANVRKHRKELINIRKRLKNNQNPDALLKPFLLQSNLTSLSLLENVHAYDLNDLIIQSNAEPTQDRLDLSFENDELNNHECMPMISGLLIHMFNSQISKLPVENQEITSQSLPDYFKCLQSGFASKEDNVRLYLLKIVANTKNAFLPYMKAFFPSVVSAVCGYLEKNSINYIIRDTIVIIIESKLKLVEDLEKKVGKCLLHLLMDKARDPHNDNFKYNLELIESLGKNWIDVLQFPDDLVDDKIKTDPELALYIIVIHLRCFNENASTRILENPFYYEFIKNSLKGSLSDNESLALLKFEAVAWIFHYKDEKTCEEEMPHLVNLLNEMVKRSHERAAKCVCKFYRICYSETKCKRLLDYVQPSKLSESLKPDCLELFLLRLPEIKKSVTNLNNELKTLKLEEILRDRIPGCETLALKIVLALISDEQRLIDENKAQTYVDIIISNFTGAYSNLLEQRRIAYSTMMKIYELYPPPDHELGIACSKGLVRALDDPDEEMQEFVLTFWRETLIIPETSCERLIFLLNMYSPDLKTSYERFICLIMLELTAKSLDINRVMFPPLTDCTYRDLQLLVPRRRMNWGSMAPLFVPSLASQFTQFVHLSQFNQEFDASKFSIFSNSLRLLATKDLEFSATVSPSQSLARSINPSASVLPDPSQNVLSKRITTSSSKTVFNTNVFKVPEDRTNLMKNEILNRERNVRIHRKYRNGDFPDVEITHASFVKCLKQLIINDWFSCKNLAIAIICNLINRLKESNKYTKFESTFEKAFDKILRVDDERNNFAATILEIIYHSKVIMPEPLTVSRICNETSSDSLGILLLEDICMNTIEDNTEDSEDSEIPVYSKKRKLNSSDVEKWIELATFYKKIGKIDLVYNIIRYKPFFSTTFQEGVLAQVDGDWKSAINSFQQTEATLEAEGNYCLQSMFECMGKLSSWNEINKKIDTYLDNDYNSIWENPRKKQLLPWIFQSQLLSALDDYTSNNEIRNISFMENFDTWIGSRVAEVKKNYGEEISMLYLCGDESEKKSQHYLNSCLEYIRDEWMRLSPLSEMERFRIVFKLQRIYNIHNHLKILDSSEVETEIKAMLHYWHNNFPFCNGDLFYINKNISYRLTIAKRLQENLGENPDYIGLFNEITHTVAEQRLKLSDVASKNRCKLVAKKHLLQVEQILGEFANDNLLFSLTVAKYKFLCGQELADVKKQFKYIIASWESVSSMNESGNIDPILRINMNNHLFDVSSVLMSLVQKNPEYKDYLTANDFVRDSLYLTSSSSEELLKALEKYSYESLKSSCEINASKEMADAHAKFGKYCYSLLSVKNDLNLFEVFMSSILNGMSIGSLECAYYFPCLLKYEYYREKTVELFISKSENVPSWLFLYWQTQIMSCLGRPMGRIVTPILDRLIADYPEGVRLNFRLLYKNLSHLKSNSDIARMYSNLFENKGIENFFDAFNNICQPEYYLRHHILETLKTSELNFSDSLDKVLSLVNEKNNFYGPIYNELKKYESDLSSVKSMDDASAKKKLFTITQNLYNAMTNRLTVKNLMALQLKDYSPYLNNFSGYNLEIEIPGQYDTFNKPLPRYHVKISQFDRYVTVMKSKCFPVKINIIGTDAKTYGFLVKFGEDLRQDQRLQQIFGIINKTLTNDANCKKRYLSINTYHVSPLTTSLGLIQWIDQTRSLKEFIEFSMPDKTVLAKTTKLFESWIIEAGMSKNTSSNYKAALTKYSSVDVVSKMKELINKLDLDYLKNTFLLISPSLDCFVSLRNNFITNYATMCIIHWIAGVGDRHLENMLIEVKNGKCYGIDFGIAFGAGIDQLPPELVPFRLTPQILGLLKPFDENALLGSTMSFVLDALREEKSRLLACFDIFINEPLDWTKAVKEKIQDQDEVLTDIRWLPESKIKIIEKKLNGTKPSIITCEELSNMHDTSLYSAFVNGTDISHKTLRATMEDDSLTSNEQVQCLLDQAKDLNLLGRMYVGWQQFV